MAKWLFILIVVYGALAAGTLIKLYAKGVRDYRLLISVLAPLCLFVAPPIAAITFWDSDFEFKGRFRVLSRIWFAVNFALFMVRVFPAFVGLIGVHLAEMSDKVKVNKQPVDGSFQCYGGSDIFKELLRLYVSLTKEESAARVA